jgi:glutamine cyclotransferase
VFVSEKVLSRAPLCGGLAALLLCCVALAAQTTNGSAGYRVIATYPHDPGAFTQGLVFVDGKLYESTGREGQSSLRMVDVQSGKVLQRHDLSPTMFGEGLTDWGSDLIQLTWKDHTAFVYDRFTFSQRRTFHYEGEGWGLTHDKTALILSDGSAYLRFIDPKTFHVVRRLRVTDDANHPVDQLNELEYVRGEIYANVWHSSKIARISPRTGKVIGWIDMQGLVDPLELKDPEAVLNGIGYDSANDRLFVTGKLWPKLFEIRVRP